MAEGSLTTPVKPPSILIPAGGERAAAGGREVCTGSHGSTPKEVKEVVLTPAEIRKQRTFKKRRRPRADRHRGRNPRARGWKQRRPPPVEPGTILARSRAQINDLADSLVEPCDGPGVSRRVLAIVDVCLRAASSAVDARTATSRVASSQERAGRYATAAEATATTEPCEATKAAGAAARPSVNRNGFILSGTDTRDAREAPEKRSQGQVASRVSAAKPEERSVRLTTAGEAVLSDIPTGAVGLSTAEIAELAAMQGLMMDRHCASQWGLSDEEEQQEDEQQDESHEALEVASAASSCDSSDFDGGLLPAEMSPEARAAALAAQDERMARHGRLQNLIHASGGLAVIRPDVSIGTKDVKEWSDFMEQGLASVEEAIANLTVKT
jgi:hypothetical protein